MKQVVLIWLALAGTGSTFFWTHQQDGQTASGNKYRIAVSYRKNLPHGSYKSWFDSSQLRDQGQFIMGIPDG
ncbi:hypothetical protein, partial [Flavihumibacter sp. CACIAM 22H1]|uniref:hypothetical protein n=1 Tax=Flavihumibacter sp. CACIAM 22H1 TaxID=1812911 RepID=UPI0025C503A9